MTSDLSMSNGKMPDFVSFLLFGLTLVVKRRNYQFLKSLKHFFFNQKNDVRLEYVLSNSV